MNMAALFAASESKTIKNSLLDRTSVDISYARIITGFPLLLSYQSYE